MEEQISYIEQSITEIIKSVKANQQVARLNIRNFDDNTFELAMKEAEEGVKMLERLVIG
jgi:hypothetical protein